MWTGCATGDDVEFGAFLCDDDVVDLLRQTLRLQIQTRLERQQSPLARKRADEVPVAVGV